MNMKVQPMPGRYLAMSFIMALVPWCVCVCVCVCVCKEGSQTQFARNTWDESQ